MRVRTAPVNQRQSGERFYDSWFLLFRANSEALLTDQLVNSSLMNENVRVVSINYYAYC